MKKFIFFILVVSIFLGVKLVNDFFPLKYREEVEKIAIDRGIDKSLVYAMIKVESDFREKIVSHKGAVGLMQVLPTTAEWILEKNGYDFDNFDLYLAEDNIFIGVLYTEYLYNRFDGDLQKIMAAYNGGSSRIKNDKWKEIEETRYYVKKVKLAHFAYRWKLRILEVF
jgi:soluble lytic murein transglycosylase